MLTTIRPSDLVGADSHDDDRDYGFLIGGVVPVDTNDPTHFIPFVHHDF
jgi:hypothetical protein